MKTTGHPLMVPGRAGRKSRPAPQLILRDCGIPPFDGGPSGAADDDEQRRTADHPIAPLFLDRWSPRSFTGEAISDADLFTILEAARWAPSASNLQPWRFLYAKRDSAEWPRFADPISPGNRGWVADTAVLLAIVSKRTRQPKDGPVVDSYSHSFDAGAAWACLALQASLIGWAAHAMGGFDVARATRDLMVPDDYRVECMAAIGRYREDAETPAKANSRAPLTSLVREGAFKV